MPPKAVPGAVLNAYIPGVHTRKWVLFTSEVTGRPRSRALPTPIHTWSRLEPTLTKDHSLRPGAGRWVGGGRGPLELQGRPDVSHRCVWSAVARVYESQKH